jgi:hypothetical protein
MMRKGKSRYALLKKRIQSQLPKKKLIGDIIINKNEYALLIDYFRKNYRRLADNPLSSIVDPLFAVALVQIAIKKYDRNYWKHVADILGLDTLTWVQRSRISNVLFSTLDKYSLPRCKGTAKTIRMHCFVSDHYATNLFNYLFAFYRIDLERDISRLDHEMMKDLFDVITRSDNTGRTYLIVQQTADAVHANPKGSKIRIRRLLKLIDRRFWDQTMPENPINRLSQYFVAWQKESDEFQTEYRRCHGTYNGKRSRFFSHPYLQCELSAPSFRLVLPSQLIKPEWTSATNENVAWQIKLGECKIHRNNDLIESVIGFKTEEMRLGLPTSYLFDQIDIKLICSSTQVRSFQIRADSVRFFDIWGNAIDSPTKGEAYAFTHFGDYIISEACTGNERRGSLAIHHFEFEHGDIVRLPDGTSLSIGKNYDEGILQRGRVTGAYAIVEEQSVSIYKKAPTVLIRIHPSKVAGTAININEKRLRLFDVETLVIDIEDKSGEKGYIIRLCDCGCVKNGIYRVHVDVPNDRSDRYWEFALIQTFSFEFEGAPYVFRPRGTIHFPENLPVISLDNNEKLGGENTFKVEITPQKDDITFALQNDDFTFPIKIDMPAFKWKFGNGDWQIEHPPEIWHGDFPTMLYLKYPDDDITISMDEAWDNDMRDVDSRVRFSKRKETHIFECDMTRFKSWIGREKNVRSLYLDFPNRTEFIRIVTKSIALSCVIHGDFQNNVLICETEIIGKSFYAADIFYNGDCIVEKAPVQNGKLEIFTELRSGKYDIVIYEQEDDGSGFSEGVYWPVRKFCQELLNPFDMRGKCIRIDYFKHKDSSIFKNDLKGQYIIKGLDQNSFGDKHDYTGQMYVVLCEGLVTSFEVKVHFNNLEKLNHIQLSVIEGENKPVSRQDDGAGFIYDNLRKILIKHEDNRLKKAEKYRRYTYVFPDEYLYAIQFIDAESPIPEVNAISASYQSLFTENAIAVLSKPSNHIQLRSGVLLSKDVSQISIDQMQLSPKTYNCLKRANRNKIEDIVSMPFDSLMKIRNLGRRSAEEIVLRLRKYKIMLDVQGNFYQKWED